MATTLTWIDETLGIQNDGTGEPENTELSPGLLPAAFLAILDVVAAGQGTPEVALSGFSSTNPTGSVVVAYDADELLDVGFTDSAGHALDGDFSGLRTTDGTGVFLYTYAGNNNVLLALKGNDNGTPGDVSDDFADPNGDVVFAAYLAEGAGGAKVWLAQFESLFHPDATDPDDTVAPDQVIFVTVKEQEHFSFLHVPSGQNLFLMVGDGTPAVGEVGLVITGRHPANQSEGEATNTGDRVNTSQGAGSGGAIGISNQMIDKGEGVYVSFVNLDASSLGFTTPNLSQTEADVEANIRFGSYHAQRQAGFAVVQLQPDSGVATLRMRAIDNTDGTEKGAGYIDGLGDADDHLVAIDGLTITTLSGAVYNFAGSGTQGGFKVTFSGGMVTVEGIGDKTHFFFHTVANHNRLLVENVGTDSNPTKAAAFDIGFITITPPVVTTSLFDNLRFDDDAPTATGTLTDAVDEDGVPGGIAGGPGDLVVPNDDGDNNEATTNGSIASVFSGGADGLASFSLSTDTSGLPGLKSLGQSVSYQVAGNTLTAYVNLGGGAGYDAGTDRAVFTFTLTNSTTGAYTFQLLDQLDHPTLNGLAGDNTENDLPVELGSILRATDGDGDTVTAEGARFTILVDDDTPTALGTAVTGIVDEDGVPGGIAGGPGDVAGAPVVVTGTVAGIFQSGADAPVKYSLSTDTSGLQALTSGGQPVSYQVSGNTLVAFVNLDATPGFTGGVDRPVFLLTITNTNTGAFTFTLRDQLDHPTLDGVAGDNTENDIVLLLGSIVQATDFDGDTVVAAPGKLAITVDDDTPVLSGRVAIGVVDEDGVPGGIAGGPGDVAGTFVTATGTVAPLFQSGADAPLSFGLSTDTSGLQALTSVGQPVLYQVAGNTLTAYVDVDGITGFAGGTDRAVFTFTITNTSTGAYSFTLLDQLDHPSLDGLPGDNTENDIVLLLGSIVQATDFDGDTVTAAAGAVRITVDDDTPTASGAGVIGTVDEDGLPGGIAGGPGDVAGTSVTATGTVAGIFQSGADAPVSFGLSTNTAGLQALTSVGQPVSYQVVGNTLTAYVNLGGGAGFDAGTDRAVFTFSITNTATGAYSFTLLDQLDHPSLDGLPGDNTENDILLQLGTIVQATDFDGDTITAGAGKLIIRIDDDTPTANGSSVIGVVDEDGLPGGIAGGPGDVAGTAVTATGTVAGVFQTGADAPLSFGLSTNTSGLQALTSAGDAVSYQVVGNTLTAFVNVGGGSGFDAGTDRAVFTFSITNAATGAYSFTLLDQLDHPTLDGLPGDDTENDIVLRLGSIVQATDYDGDTVTAGAFKVLVRVDDDTPTATGAAATGTVDEDGLPGGIAGGPGDVAGTAVTATGTVAGIFQSGADAPASYGLSSDTSGLAALTSAGDAVSYQVDGNTLTAFVNVGGGAGYDAGTDRAVFTFSITNTTTGAFSFTLLDQLDHPTLDGLAGDDTENDIVLLLGSIVQATDFDGDSVAASEEQVAITVDDDTPTATGTATAGTVDEDGLPDGIAGGPGDVAGEAVTATGTVAGIFQSGADAPLSYGLSTVTSGLPALTSAGQAVAYQVSGNTLTAFVNLGGGAGYDAGTDRAVFTFGITDASTGAYTFTLLDQLDHPSLDGLAGDDTENDLLLQIGSIVQATDFDGDTVTAAANKVAITVDDDTPTATGTAATGTVDEDGLPGGIAGGIGDVAGTAVTATGSVAGIFQSGADAPASFGLSGITSGLQALTSHGGAVSYQVTGGNTLTAFVNVGGGAGFDAGTDRAVFTFAITDAATGAYSFTLLDRLDHPTLDGLAGDDTENDIVLQLGGIVQATDFDGDTVTAAPAKVEITVDDDSATTMTPDALTVANEVGATGEAALGSFHHVGADVEGSAVFVGTDGSVLQGMLQDGTPTLENLNVNGAPIYLFGFGTDTLTATTDATNTDAAARVFVMTLQPDNSVLANDIYDIELFQEIAHLVNVVFGDFTSGISSGNPLTVVVNNIGGSAIDALFSGFVDKGDGSTTQTTVNVSQSGVGVGTGQDFNFDPNGAGSTDDLSDRVRIQFLEDGGDGVLQAPEARTVNGFTFVVNQDNPPADDADMVLRVYDAAGAQLQITKIEVNGQTLVGSGAVQVTSKLGGLVSAVASGQGYELHGLHGGTAGDHTDNDSVTVFTAAGYERIDISAIGNDSNKDTFDILLESVILPAAFDIDLQTQANLTDFDGDTTAAATLAVTLDADGVFA